MEIAWGVWYLGYAIGEAEIGGDYFLGLLGFGDETNCNSGDVSLGFDCFREMNLITRF